MSFTPSLDTTTGRPRRNALLESLRSVTPFRSPKTPTETKLRKQSYQQPPGIGVSSKPPFEPRPARPEIDQSVDLLAGTGVIVSPPEVFALLLPRSKATTTVHPLFALPPPVRRQIYGYCLPDGRRKISLSPRFATKAVWPTEYFASPWDVLEDVMGGLGSFKTLRNDIMTYFWTEYQFHVTIGPFSGPMFSPLSHIWMQNYLGIVQNLTVEADLTRFGGSQLVDAPKFGYDVENIEALLVAIVDGISDRREEIPMAEFNLMCRRYAGFRPFLLPAKKIVSKTSEDTSNAVDRTSKTSGVTSRSEHTSKSSEDIPNPPEETSKVLEVRKPVPYSPEECMFLCDTVSDLWGIVQSSRISGFTLPYTQLLLTAMFNLGNEKSNFKTPEGSPWPISIPGSVTLPTPKVASEFEFGLQPSMSRVTTDEIEDKIQQLEKSEDTLLITETSDTTTSRRRYSRVNRRCTVATEDSCRLAELVPTKSNIPSINGSDVSENEVSTPHLSRSETLQSRLAEVYPARPYTPEQRHSTSILGETPKLGDLPTSPNTMNRLNEQDPAFRRTLDALRLIDSQNKALADLPTSQSVLFSNQHQPKSVPDDCNDLNLGKPTLAATGKSHPSFMSKIKGMFSK